MSPKSFADAEGAVRAWARAHPTIAAQVVARVFFGVPEGYDIKVQGPLITLRRVGGRPDAGEAPIDNPLVQFECFGRTKAEAAAVAAAVKGASESMAAGTPMGASAVGYGASVELDLWAPDPATDKPRYLVDVAFTVKSTTAEAA